MTADLLNRTVAPLRELQRIAAAGRLWAILDACDAPAVRPKVDELGLERARCLYTGKPTDPNWDTAPFLVHADAALVGWIRENLWKEPWGVFAVSDADIRTLRDHFREQLLVLDEENEPLFFAFYDPRVLRTFLPTCDQSQLDELFGPVAGFGIADPEKDEVTFLGPATPARRQT